MNKKKAVNIIINAKYLLLDLMSYPNHDERIRKVQMELGEVKEFIDNIKEE